MITIRVVRKAMVGETFDGWGWVLWLLFESHAERLEYSPVYPNSIAAFQAGRDIVRSSPKVFDRVAI